MRADRAVEPTKSENITATWRRSAVSRGDASTGAEPGVAVGLGIEELAAVPERRDAKLLQVLRRQARKNRLVYLVLAERSLILS